MPHEFIRSLTGKTRSRKADIQLGLMLAFIAGAINAGGFMAVGTYTSHMTGMVSAIADYTAMHQWNAAMFALFFVVAFILGSVLSTVIIRWGRARELHSQYALALLVEAFLLLAFGIAASGLALPVAAIVLLLCFIMGLQNAIITKISNAEIRTTHITGLATDIGIGIGRYLYSGGNSEKLGLHAALLGAFLTGGLVGAVLFRHIGFATTIPLAFLLLTVAALPLFDDLRLKKL